MCPPRFARLKVGSSFRVLNSDRSAASGLPIWRVAILKILAPTSSALATTGVAAARLMVLVTTPTRDEEVLRPVSLIRNDNRATDSSNAEHNGGLLFPVPHSVRWAEFTERTLFARRLAREANLPAMNNQPMRKTGPFTSR